MNKKILLILMFAFMVMPLTSALEIEIDNYGSYDKNTRTAIVNNCAVWVGTCIFDGGEIGGGQLITPQHNKVGVGKRTVIAEIDLWLTRETNYNEVIKNINLYNKDYTDWENHKFDKTVDLEMRTYVDEVVIDYNSTCPTEEEKKIIGDNWGCKKTEIGSHIEPKEKWIKVTPANLKKSDGKVRVRLVTETFDGEKGEWIFELFGVEQDQWAEWEASIEVEMESVWLLDANDLSDYIGTNNATNVGTINSTGILGDGRYQDGNDYLSVGDLDGWSSELENNATFGIWFKGTSTSAQTLIGCDDANTRLFQIVLNQGGAGKVYLIMRDDGGSRIWGASSAFANMNDGNWHLLIVSIEAPTNTIAVYIDNTKYAFTYSGQESPTGFSVFSAPFFIGAHRGSTGTPTSFFTGNYDQPTLWTRDLSATERSNYYNAGVGIAPTGSGGDSAPTVSFVSPANATTYTTLPTVDFTCYGEDDLNFTEMEFYLNGSLTQTNSSGLNASNYIFQETLPDGIHNWSCTGNDNNSQQTSAGTRWVTVDTTPFIDFASPTQVDNYNSSTSYIPINITLTETYFQNATFTFSNGTAYTFTDSTRFINYSFATGSHDYNVTTCTTTGQCNSTDTRTINIDVSAPVLSSASNLTNLTAFDLPTNSTWTYNATDTAINTCYYNTTDDVSYKVVTCNSTIQTAWNDRGYKTIQYCADDDFGNEQCNQETIFVYWIQDTIGSDRSSVAEGFNVVFNLTVNMTNIPSTTATLMLNNTIYSPTTTQAGTNGYYFERTVFIPTGWGAGDGADFEWFWNYTIVGEVTNQSTDHENLTVYTLDIDDCSIYDTTILNFTLRDEKTSQLINESAGTNVELDVTLQSKIFQDVTLTHSITYTDENNPVACIPSLNESQYWIDITMGYDSTDHVWEFFYLEDGTLNETRILDTQTTTEIDLYNLETADSTSFLFNFFDIDGLAVDDTIVHVFRQYIGEGIFKEVERSKADQNGETIVHLVEEDVIYYFLITQYGIPIYTSSHYTALCQSTPCEIQIEESGEIASFPTDWDLIDNGAFTISSSATSREVSLEYQFNESDTINLTVYKYNSDGSYSSINSSGATGTSGVITLAVPQSAGNVSFFASVDQDTDHVKSEWVDFTQKSQDFFGVVLSLFLAGIIILTLALFAVNEGVATIGYVILGIFVSGALGLLNTGLSTGVNIIAYLVSAGALLIWKLTRRRP